MILGKAGTLLYYFMLPVLLVSILSLLVLLFYNLAIHPLRSYPGPLLARISTFPVLYHAYKGDLHYYLYQLHYKYGKYVRYTPNKLSINDPKALNEIYGFNKNTGKLEENYRAFRINEHAVNTFNTSSKEAHRRKRRILAKGFSETALASYGQSISVPLDELILRLRGSDKETSTSAEWRSFNLAHEANCLMLDVMGHLCFGASFGFLSGKGDAMLSQMHKRAVRIYMTFHEPLFKTLRLDRLMFPELVTANTALGDYARGYTTQRIERHRAGDAKEDFGHNDFLSHLLDARDDETNTTYSDNELLGEAVLLMMAGSDTTATAVTATIFYVTLHQEKLAKLEAELFQAFKSVDEIQVAATENCKYLRACIDEAMRLCPPAPTNIPRSVGPGGIKVLGMTYPEGVNIGVPNFTLFRNQESFRQPHAYIPERWIVDPEAGYDEESIKRAQSTFKPFSIGPRHCIAQRLALKELSYLIAKIIYLFEIEVVGDGGKLQKGILPGIGNNPLMEQTDVFTSLESGPMVRLRERKQQDTVETGQR